MVITKITHECTGLYPSDHASSSSWFLSKTWKLLYICLESHCKTIAYKVTTTIPLITNSLILNSFVVSSKLQVPSCKSMNLMFALCN